MVVFSSSFGLCGLLAIAGALGLYLLNYWTFYHKAVLVDESHVNAISQFSSNLTDFWTAFDNIAVVRVPGTPGHVQVQDYIKGAMIRLGWDITEDKFVDRTPFGDIPFNNIIATHNPLARRFLDIACHYDSKYFKNFKFIAATDSAAPCAMMIQLASNLQQRLDEKKNDDISLRFIFFDGEEAFVEWTDTDSLYGSRHLAEKWAREPYPEGGGDSNQLDRIDMLVLLDLLGAKSPQFYNFFPNTQNWYKMMVGAEDKLTQGRHLFQNGHGYFKRMSTNNHVSDDHLPFLQRDVPILHIIPMPFPKVWHKEKDNRDIIDEPTVMNLVKIIGTFIYEYLQLHT